MNAVGTLASPFCDAVSAIDRGDVAALEHLLTLHPSLVRDRVDYGEGYFSQPYLLWFVAENPVRNGSLPGNIGEVVRTILRAARSEAVENLREQVDYALGLVCSGRVPRECGVQGELIDLLVAAGANPDNSMTTALAHRERGAVDRLFHHGATLSLLAAACLGREEDVRRLAPLASQVERQAALVGAAFYSQTSALSLLLGQVVDVSAYSPPNFHPHGTALHHAVDSGSLEVVRLLVEAGAPLDVRDRIYHGTPLGWAEYLHQEKIAEYLRSKGAPS